MATYAVTVRNPGTAPARNVNLSIALPAGAKYLSGIERARVDPAGDKLQWTLESLGPDSEQNFALKCRLGATGISRLQLAATADDDLTARAETVVQVDGVADLTLNVKDPAGPMPVGEETVYEVLVRNRGTKEAQGVEVSGYFSRGVEPTAAEGAPAVSAPARSCSSRSPRWPPARKSFSRFMPGPKSPATTSSGRKFVCKPVGARLISEATNLYYGNNAGPQMADESSGERSAVPHEAMRPIPHPVQDDQPLISAAEIAAHHSFGSNASGWSDFGLATRIASLPASRSSNSRPTNSARHPRASCGGSETGLSPFSPAPFVRWPVR